MTARPALAPRASAPGLQLPAAALQFVPGAPLAAGVPGHGAIAVCGPMAAAGSTATALQPVRDAPLAAGVPGHGAIAVCGRMAAAGSTVAPLVGVLR
ncbi:MAG: hypothetical protein M0Z63_11630 [Actinomycetota bacterium]|nr:hypothetical protein [Actinomycetota bacterium]